MVKVTWAPTAVTDIQNIAEYISKDSLQSAIVTIHHQARLLHNNPVIKKVSGVRKEDSIPLAGTDYKARPRCRSWFKKVVCLRSPPVY